MPSNEQLLQRKENMASICAFLQEAGEATRQQLSQQLHLSWGCVSELTAIMLQQGDLVEEKTDANGRTGRRPTVLRKNREKCVIGIDINRIGLSVSVCDFRGNCTEKQCYPINLASAQALQASVVAALKPAIDKYQHCALAIGVAMQGEADEDGIYRQFRADGVKLPFEPEKLLREQFGLPVVVEHDPNCILYDLAAKRGSSATMMVRVDSGVGVAVVGTNGFFSYDPLELGHVVVEPETGGRLQNYVTIDAIEAIGAEKIEKINDLEFVGKYLGTAVGNLCNLLSVRKVFFCGELMQYAQRFWPALQKAFEKAAPARNRPELTVAQISDASLGAAKLAMSKYPY